MIKRHWNYFAAIILGICWGWLLFTFVLQRFNFEKIISPLTNPIFHHTVMAPALSGYKLFSFAPGWAYNYIDRVDLSGIEAVAHFDVPVNDDGTLMQDITGYELLKSDKTLDLFQRARSQNIQALITLSQTDIPTIKSILNNPSAQQNLVDESLAEMNDTGATGININFELVDEKDPSYRQKFTNFVKNFSDQLHSRAPGSYIAITLYPQATTDQTYDLRGIASSADRIFVQAGNFPVPEVRNGKISVPLYAGKEKDYLAQLGQIMKEFSNQVPKDKLVLERAWYGNGENYPMYEPDFTRSKRNIFDLASSNQLKTPLSPEILNQLLDGVPDSAKAAARHNLPIIAKALEQEGILNRNVLAYALATVEHETAGTFEPISEFKGRKSARRLGYEGGANFYGRGFIQLTHLRNYEKMGERLGLGDLLAREPDLVSKPEIAAAVLAVFFKENGVAKSATEGDFVGARIPINPDYMGWQIATLAWKYII